MVMPPPHAGERVERVIPPARARRIEQNAEDLRIRHGDPATEDVQRDTHDEAGEQTAEEIEGRGSDDEGEEEETALHAPDRERSIQRPIHPMDQRIGVHTYAPHRSDRLVRETTSP